MNNNPTLYLTTLKHHFGYDAFRGIQLDIIESIATGRDTLGLMPTGGGKSITFQVPALTMDGVCLVVTPLISLMIDQVEHLRRRGIKAEAIHSGLPHNEIQRILDNTIYGAVKFLYVSPERLSSQLFQSKLYYMKVCFVTVDEAHCISQWGYDFRPSYLQINQLRKLIPDAPILALTATATPEVIDDIQEQLSFKERNVFRMSFQRENISYVVRNTNDRLSEMIHIIRSVSGSTIIYTRNRKHAHELAELLTDQGILSTYYHAGLPSEIKQEHQSSWQRDECRVIVATNAFGMGIDKPDVRLVIHYDCPDSLEAYFQEAGRVGRDGKRSYAVLLYDNQVRRSLQKRLNYSFPNKDDIRTVYDHLAYFFDLANESGQGMRRLFNLELFCIRFHHYPSMVEGALRILQNAGYIEYEADPDSQPRVKILVGRDDLYDINYLSSDEELVIMTLMRYYGSLFSEFTYINEQRIAEAAGFAIQNTNGKKTTGEARLRNILIGLSQRHIIQYIPRSHHPIITYTQQRIPSERLTFPKAIYETLRDQAEKRINSVLHYAESSTTCRSLLLLSYFGEKDSKPCEQCDVCLSERTTKDNNSLKERIIQYLSDEKPHTISDLLSIGIDRNKLSTILGELRQEELIANEGPYIRLADT